MGSAPQTDMQDVEAVSGRLLQSFLGTMDTFAIYLGLRLGWYESLTRDGPATSTQLAARTKTNERYAREWLEQQAASGLLTVEDVTAESSARSFRITPAFAEALTDRDSLFYLAPLVRSFAALLRQIDPLVEAYRTGGGVSWAQFGEEMRTAQGDANRPFFLRSFAQDVLPTIADVHDRLGANPPARVADIACGMGWSSIGLATAYPRITIDGYDIDGPSIAQAQKNAAAAGVAERVHFHARDAGDPTLAGGYALVLVTEALHDMARPVEVLRSMRRLVAPGGAVLVVDERTAETFTSPADDMERLFYGYSLLCCLPDGMSQQPSAATGTVMRPATLRSYATEAGFRAVEPLEVEAGFFRVYRLVV